MVFQSRTRRPANDRKLGTAKTRTALRRFLLFLRLLKEDALFKRRIELHEFYFALDFLLILARPDDMVGLRGLQPEQAVL